MGETQERASCAEISEIKRLDREAFADEASWLQYQANLVELLRGGTLPQGRAERRARKGSRKYDREQKAAYNREYFQLHRDELLEYLREYHRRHRDQHVAYCRQYYVEHHEELLAYGREYAAKHPEERARNNRTYYVATHPGAKTAAQLLQEGEAFDAKVVALRSEGRVWREIAVLLGVYESTCRKAYKRAIEGIPRRESGGAGRRRNSAEGRIQDAAG
jgi:hypothetical protein